MREAAWPSRPRVYYALLILTLALMVATIDRGVLSVLVEYIKRDLHVSDTQFSVLSGFAFVFFYAFLELPIARLADRHSRRLIIGIGIGIAFWSRSMASSGYRLGLAALIVSTLGLLVGGWLAEYYTRRGRDDANLRVLQFATVAVLPTSI